MLITCPSCSKKYSIKAQALGAKGRTVKCKNCGHKWFQNIPGAKAAAKKPADSDTPPPPFDQDDALGGGIDAGFENAGEIPDPPPIPDQIIREDDEKPPSKKGLIGWIIFLVVFGGLVGAVVALSDQITEQLPEMAIFYDAIGWDVHEIGEGLEIRDLPPERRDEDGIDVLVLSAEIFNVTEIEQKMPVVRLELFDPLDRVVQRKDIRTELQVLAPGEVHTVSTKLRNPNPNATKVGFRFIDPRQEEER